jgi:hypoxanthine phosphoribosyltransferase
MQESQLTEVIPPEAVQARIAELGRDITARFAGQPLVAVCVLKGAFLFFADLVRHLDLDLTVDFVRLSSYGQGTSRGKHQVFAKDVEISLAGKNVLVVEDIVDTGHSADFLLRTFRERNPRDLALTSLVDKYERREVGLTVDFPGFHLKKGFLVGFGMDHAERLRELRGIFELTLA